MATLVTTPIKTFISGETVVPATLNQLGQSTVALTAGTIVDADVSASAAIALSKLATGALPAAITTTTANMVDASVTAAKLDGAQTGSAPIYGCRAWVNFDGTKDTTGAASTANTNRLIRASGNVSSVLRNAQGTYTITFTTAMPDANYCVSASCSAVSGNNGLAAPFSAGTSASQQIVTTSANNAFAADVASAHVAIFR